MKITFYLLGLNMNVRLIRDLYKDVAPAKDQQQKPAEQNVDVVAKAVEHLNKTPEFSVKVK
jgi:hypothetical protein